MKKTDTAPKVFLVDDDDDLRPALIQALELEDHNTVGFSDATTVLGQITRDFYGVVVTDIRMPGMDGVELLERLLAIDPALPVIVITGHADVPLAVRAMQLGAYDFVEKPFPVKRLTGVVGRAVEKRRLVLENRALRYSIEPDGSLADVLVGSSMKMVKLREQVAALSSAHADVLVYGETGSGKEVVSRALHRFSDRSQHPFVAINCGAIPADIIESELFGHEKGSFTSAHEKRIGKLQHANGGTVLLDEIESMPLDVQIKLLRVIEERAIEPVGSNTPVPIDVRFVAASKRDLQAESDAGRFRQDLFYRLDVVSLDLPALKDRKEDIPELFYHLAREARAKYRKEIPDMGPEFLDDLVQHDWPGNVRELRNVADRFVLGLGTPFERKPNVMASQASAGNHQHMQLQYSGPLAEQVAQFEKQVIRASLDRHGGKIKPAFEELQVSRKTFYDKMKRYGL